MTAVVAGPRGRVGLALLVLVACHRPPAPGPAAPVAAPAPAPPCPIVPVGLVMSPAGGSPLTVLALDASGSLDLTFIERKPGVAKLDPQGCLVGKDGLWAEWAPHDKLWTPHETLDVAGNCIVPPNGRAQCIAADGKVELRTKDAVEVAALATMAISGYRDEARCAALMLLATFAGMMPSMAVVDGKPARARAPEGSRCAAFRLQ